MSRKSKVVAIVFILSLFVYIGYKYVINLYGVSEYTRNRENNSAQTVVLSKGEYQVGIDFKQGFYDITSITKEEVMCCGVKFNQNGTIRAVSFHNTNRISVYGNGKVRLSPATFQTLKKVKNYYEIVDSGYYTVGTELKAGKYEFIIDNNEKEINLFINITSSENIAISSLDYDGKKAIHSEAIILQDGDIISVNKTDLNNRVIEKPILILKEVNE